MKIIALFSILAALLIGTTGATLVAPAEALAQDDELNRMVEDFADFAQSRLVNLDKSQIMSKDRMRIVKEGSLYKATYQVYDRKSLSTSVRRSRSDAIPYVGVMKFNVMVMEAVAESPAAVQDAEFSAVQIKPNRQLFSYKSGAWE